MAPSSDPLQPMSLSSQASKDLLALLLERGYLHGNAVTPIQADPFRNNPEHTPTGQRETNDHLSPQYSEADDDCQIVLLNHSGRDDDAFCCTYPVLQTKLIQELKQQGGRCDVIHLVTALQLRDEVPLVRILERQQQEPASQVLFQLGKELYSTWYLDRISQRILETLLIPKEDTVSFTKDKAKGVKTPGFALISDLALLDFQLPMDAAVAALTERIPNDTGIQLIKLDVGPVVVSDTYLAELKREVMSAFRVLQEPASVATVCRDHHWDIGLVAGWVNQACQENSLPGDMHGGEDSASLMAGRVLYTPRAHVQALRQAVDESFTSHGYMTATKGAALGLSKSKMGQYIQESFVSTIKVF